MNRERPSMARDKRDLFSEVPDYDLYVRHLHDFEGVVRVRNPDADDETVAELVGRERTLAAMLLEQAGVMLGETVAPLADKETEYTINDDGEIVWPRSVKKPFAALAKFEYVAMSVDETVGGHGLSHFIAGMFHELLYRADPGFASIPLLRDDILNLVANRGSEWIREHYAKPSLSGGATTASMQLTEPHAGSDVGGIHVRATVLDAESAASDADLTTTQREWVSDAVAAGETVARIKGTKTFITAATCDAYDHLALVLARDEDRYDDTLGSTEGLSLYLVPKWIGFGDERDRNTTRCTSVEHKQGILRSPTSEVFHDDSLGVRIGDAGKGLRYMFEVMNPARAAVTRQALAIMQEALLLARAYAGEREQFGVPIREFGQVAQMLAEGETYSQFLRAITTETSHAHDMASAVRSRLASMEGSSPAKEQLEHQLARLESKIALLIPAMKFLGPTIAERQTSNAVQIEGGRGFMMESRIGALNRDVKITGIYEATNEINAALFLAEILKGEMLPKSRAKLSWLLEEIEEAAAGFDDEFSDAISAVLDVSGRLRESLAQLIEFKTLAMQREGGVTGGDNDLSLLAKTVTETMLRTYGCYLLLRQAQTLKNAHGQESDDQAKTGEDASGDAVEKSRLGSAYRRKADIAAMLVEDLQSRIVEYSNALEALTPETLPRTRRVAAGLR